MASSQSNGEEDNATLWVKIKAARVRLSSDTDFYRNYGFPPSGVKLESNASDQNTTSNLVLPSSATEDPQTSMQRTEDHQKDLQITSSEQNLRLFQIGSAPSQAEEDISIQVTLTNKSERDTFSTLGNGNVSCTNEQDENGLSDCRMTQLPQESEVIQAVQPLTPKEASERGLEDYSTHGECVSAPLDEVTRAPSIPDVVTQGTQGETLSIPGSFRVPSQTNEINSTGVSATHGSLPLQSPPSTQPEALEQSEASRMPDSDDSDIVMLRPRNQNSGMKHQENINPTEPEPRKHRNKTRPQRLSGRNGKRHAVSDGITDVPSNTPAEQVSTAGNTGQEGSASQPWSPYKVAPPEVQEELKKLQEEAMAKAAERWFEEPLNSNPETLSKIREGPGADPECEEFYQIATLRAIHVPDNGPESSNALLGRFRFPQGISEDKRKELQWSLYSQDAAVYPTLNEDGRMMLSAQPTPEYEERSALLASNDGGSLIGLRQPPQPPPDFPVEVWDHIPADWNFRPNYFTNVEVSRQWFWRWLDTTMTLSYPVDIYHKAFFDGTAHTDGEQGLFIPDIEDHDTEIDMTDEETRLHYHETVNGYVHNYKLHLRKEAEDRNTQIKRERAVYLESFLNQQEPNPYVPKANIYLRPAENRDVPGLLELCNWYIHNTALCADLETLTHAEMVQRIADSKQEKLPFIVAVERNNRHALDHRERVLGYALAADYIGQSTAGRHTVELEVFVSDGSKRLGVGRCLMDKLLEVCDATYVPHWGYFFDSELDDRPGYTCGGRRTLARLIFTYCYPEDDLSEYQRVKEWLKETYNFHEQGVLKGVCVKFSKLHNVSYLVRNVANFTP